MNSLRLIPLAPVLVLASSFLAPLAHADPLPNAWRINDLGSAAGSTLNYTNQLNAMEQMAATNSGGFIYSVRARFVADHGSQTMAMAYGMGSRRFLIWFDLNAAGDLIANLDGVASYTLTTGGTGTNFFHQHEIHFDPGPGTATYLVDGVVKRLSWTSSDFDMPAGQVYWGAGSSPGQGIMNFHLVTFEVFGQGVVRSYNAGIAGDANPEVQGWTRQPPGDPPPSGTAATLVTDSALLPRVTTLAATNFTSESAQLHGQVNPAGTPTIAWFEWGTDTNYGNATPAQSAGYGLSLSNLAATLTGLVGQGYHCRLVASNAYGVVTGGEHFFSLSFLPVPIPGLPGVSYGSVAWGDYDNDGRLDFLLTGLPFVSQLWRNTGSGFSNVTTTVTPDLPQVFDSAVTWGDYDNDGRLDFLLTGATTPPSPTKISQLWRNMGSKFTNVTAYVAPNLPGIDNGSMAWGDYDNDGRLDFLLTGNSMTGLVAQVWRNTGEKFTNVTANVASGLRGVFDGSVAWGDYDNDGRLDFLINGTTNWGPDGGISEVWRNTGSGFSNVTADVAAGLSQVCRSPVLWGDYDNDGWLDFLLTGQFSVDTVAHLWRNTGGGFSNMTAQIAPSLAGVTYGSAAWGDYNNDGRLDFLLTGATNSLSFASASQLWQNTGTGFSNVTATVAPTLPGVYYSSVAWGDYDNDGRLDFLLTGSGASQLWRNNLPLSNAPPAAPSGLSATTSGNSVAFHWNAPADDLTPALGLHYNLRLGSAPGASDVLAPMAFTNGLRLLPALGNAQTGTNAMVLRLPPGRTYYWSVQALDTSFAGSPFAAEGQFTLGPLLINPIRYPGGQFEFYFTNQSVLNFDVLVSTNIALPVSNWQNLGSALHLGGGLYRFTDASAIGQSRRYYILRAQ